MPIMNYDLRHQGYNCYPGSGWRRYGQLIVNFHNHQITSVFLRGICLYSIHEQAIGMNIYQSDLGGGNNPVS